MSLAVRVDPDDPTPPYEQLRRQLVALVDAGTLVAGTRLPSVRQLAADLRLAPGTVARTYRELEASGVLRSRRGAGTVVAQALARPEGSRQELLDQVLGGAVARAGLLGATADEVRAAVERALAAQAHRA